MTFQIASVRSIVVLLAAISFVNFSDAQSFRQIKEDWEIGPFTKLDPINPILGPRNDTAFFCPVRQEFVFWEAKDVFNPTAIVMNDVIQLIYRAEDYDGAFAGTSRIGLATSSDGMVFNRELVPIFYPDNDDANIYEWEGGCEDPRIVADEHTGTFVMTYTAYNGSLARLMVASSPDLRSWTKHGPIFGTAQDGKYIDLWSKSGSIVTDINTSLATKIDGSYYMYWGDSDIYLATSPDLINWTPVTRVNGDGEAELIPVFSPRPGKFDSELVEPGPQALLRDDGIIMIYNSKNYNAQLGGDPNLPEGTYAAGQILFNATNPIEVLKRSEEYFFKPDRDYEIIGQVNNVVFLEGLVYFKNQYWLYYGTADSKIATAVTSS